MQANMDQQQQQQQQQHEQTGVDIPLYYIDDQEVLSLVRFFFLLFFALHVHCSIQCRNSLLTYYFAFRMLRMANTLLVIGHVEQADSILSLYLIVYLPLVRIDLFELSSFFTMLVSYLIPHARRM